MGEPVQAPKFEEHFWVSCLCVLCVRVIVNSLSLSLTLSLSLSLCYILLYIQGPGNKGFDVLYQNFKSGISASRELNEFVKERWAF